MVVKTFFIEARVAGSRTVMARIKGCLLSVRRVGAVLSSSLSSSQGRAGTRDLAGIPIVTGATSARDSDMAAPAYVD
jgi:hypothetical protein